MTFGNPWAFGGLALLAVPIAIHLLGRHRARVVKFPSLRFLVASRLTPTRRTRPSDLLLLAIRMAIVAAAVFALAQPVFDRASTKRDLGRVVRAIVVDTSKSMGRPGPTGESALTVARRESAKLATEATINEVTETAAPGHVLAGASQWLSTQPGTRELIVVSDFQLGAIDSTTLGAVAPEVGVRLVRINVAAPEGAIHARTGDRVARITPGDGRTDVEWSPASKTIAAGPVILAGGSERGYAEAARKAAGAGTLSFGRWPQDDSGRWPQDDSGPPVAIIYKEYAGRAELARAAKPIDKAWMGDAIAHLHADSTLVAAAATADVAGDTSLYGAPFAVIVRNARRQPVVLASRGDVAGRAGLQLWVLADAGSLTSAALIAGLSGVAAAPVSELEPRSLPIEVLSRWERPAGKAALPRTGMMSRTDDGSGSSHWS